MPTQNTMSWVNYAQNYQEKGESIVQKIIWCIGNVKTHVDSALQSPAKNDSNNAASRTLSELNKLDLQYKGKPNLYIRQNYSIDELCEAYTSLNNNFHINPSEKREHTSLMKIAYNQIKKR